MNKIEPIFFRMPYGLYSRVLIVLLKFLGIKIGKKNRFEPGNIVMINQIKIGNNNAFTKGWRLWPEVSPSIKPKIIIGSKNYFNRNLFIDACCSIEIGDENMIGPDVYITDSNHSYGKGINPHNAPMQKGLVKIGNYCWIGAKVIILKDVELGDYCTVAAGAVVTKSFPKGSLIAGIPAKLIKNFNDEK